MKPAEVKRFQKVVWDHYKKHGRDLPWRQTTNPYHILVSEIMLQQTQVSRVIPKYGEFMRIFPTVGHLAVAPSGDVLKVWQGLGYNRRALALKKIADVIVREHRGRVPATKEALEQLPGIGPYTAAAIRAFAYGQPEVCIETNIRRVFIHHFFSRQKQVNDKDILPLIEQTLPQAKARQWYWALMDYGSWLARQRAANPNRKSAHYARQSKFEGSHRQLRGAVLRAVLAHKKISPAAISRLVMCPQPQVRQVIAELSREGLIAI